MAQACANCGYAYNSDDAATCVICDRDLSIKDRVLNHSSPNSQVPLQQNRTVLSAHVSQTEGILPPYRNGRDVPDRSITPEQQDRTRGAVLEGRISDLERQNERPPANILKGFSVFLLILLFILPYGTFFLLAGIISFIFAFLGISSIAQLFNPLVWTNTLLELLEVIVLRRLGGTNTVPIYRGIVEDTNDQEHVFMIRGPLIAGSLVRGHHVRFEGRTRNGTFYIREGEDQTLNARIRSGYRNPWRVIFVILIIVYLILGGFGGYLFTNWPMIMSGLHP